MNRIEKNENLKFAIERFDHYYDSINNKGNALLAILIFLLGGLSLAMHNTLHLSSCLVCYLSTISLVINLLAIFTAILSLKPYTKSDQKKESYFNFLQISSLTERKFRSNVQVMNPELVHFDLIRQTYTLSTGLKYKFSLLNLTIWFLLFEIILLTICGFATLNPLQYVNL